FLESIIDGVMTVVTVVVMFVYSPLLSFIALGALVLYVLCRWIRYQALMTATRSQIVFAAKQQSHFLESMRGIRSIKLFQREHERRAAWLALLVDQINAGLRTQKLQLLYEFGKAIVLGTEAILITWFGARMIIDGNFSVGALMAFVSYRGQFDSRV